jgi:hypothetical protein
MRFAPQNIPAPVAAPFCAARSRASSGVPFTLTLRGNDKYASSWGLGEICSYDHQIDACPSDGVLD